MSSHIKSITRIGRHALKRADGTVVSTHTDPDEPFERLKDLAPGTYEISVADKRVVTGVDAVAPAPTPAPPVPQPPPPLPPNQPPTVAIVMPAVVVAGSAVPIKVVANDPDGTIKQVTIIVGTVPPWTLAAPPWEATWSGATEGEHVVRATATDSGGRASSVESVLRVSPAVPVPAPTPPPAPSNKSPVVRVSSPSAGTWEPGALVFGAEASDPDGVVKRVDLCIDGVVWADVHVAPWRDTWRPAPGAYTLTAVAHDDAGAMTTSEPVRVVIAEAAPAPVPEPELPPPAPPGPELPPPAPTPVPVPVPVPPPAPGTSKPALTVADFQYLGYYDVQTFGNDTAYMRGLAHRYVAGQLRFLSLTHTGKLHEFAAPAQFGQTVTALLQQWGVGAVHGDHCGIWWDEAQQRLWAAASVDYGDAGTYYPTRISTCALGANGAISNVKTVSLKGINSKRVYGGVAPVPAWVQSKFGIGPYAVGFGGYTSLGWQTSRCALGPSLIAMPDPTPYPNGAEIPSSAIRVLLDTDGNNRGVRKTIPLNYFDGGDARQNPSSPPTVPPLTSGAWLSPNAQGLGWMVWGDSYYQTGVWIDGPAKQGYVAIASLAKGKAWYQGSTLHSDDRQYELHVWDSNLLGNGPLTRPTSMAELVLPRVWDPMAWDGNVTMCNIAGASYDPTTKRLYAIGYPLGGPRGAPWNTGRIYVWQVAS